MGTQPVYGNYGGNMTTQQASSGGGWQDFLKNNAGSVLAFVGNLLGGLGQERGLGQAQIDLASRGQEYAQENARNAQIMALQSAINRAPLADKGQYLALNMTAPAPFQPRDYTRGVTQIDGQPTGGAAAQLAANRTAASNYRAGAGGVDTSAMNLLMSRLGGPERMATNTTSTVNYGGKAYTPAEWSQYLNDHPDDARRGL